MITLAESATKGRFALLFLALIAAMTASCGDSPSEPTVKNHLAGASVYLYSEGPTIKDVEILVDDESVARQQFPTGSYFAQLSGSKAFAYPGNHVVSLRISDQTVSPTVYQIEGAAFGMNTETNSQVTLSLTGGNAMRTVSTGQKLSVTISVP